jgi:MerR family mercuric resistance operon transcriptional regulator
MTIETTPLRIGALAQAAGVGVETIRYYQRRGLLGEPQRPPRGQRIYPAQYVDRVRFIRRAQRLGFSLDEIATLLTLDSGTGHARAHALATHRVAEIEARIADLSAMREALAELALKCEHTRGRVACPIIATLTGRGNDAPRPAAALGRQARKKPARATAH